MMSTVHEFFKDQQRYEWDETTLKVYHWKAEVERNYTNIKADSLEEAREKARPT